MYCMRADSKNGNPDYIDGKPCVYVGMTGLDLDPMSCDAARGREV